MKKLTLAILIGLLVTLICGCTSKQSIEEKPVVKPLQTKSFDNKQIWETIKSWKTCDWILAEGVDTSNEKFGYFVSETVNKILEEVGFRYPQCKHVGKSIIIDELDRKIIICEWKDAYDKALTLEIGGSYLAYPDKTAESEYNEIKQSVSAAVTDNVGAGSFYYTTNKTNVVYFLNNDKSLMLKLIGENIHVVGLESLAKKIMISIKDMPSLK